MKAATRTWGQLVAEGRKVVEDYQWKLGDLAREVETEYRESSLAKYAVEIGVEYNTLRQYRTVSAAYPENDERSSNPWSVHMILAGQDDRAELIQGKMTVQKARDLVAQRQVPPLPPPSSAFDPAPDPESQAEPEPDPEPELEGVTCPTCGDFFAASQPVWHCPDCGGHQGIDRTVCHNCYTEPGAEPPIIVPRDESQPPAMVEDPWLYVIVALRQAVKMGVSPEDPKYRKELTQLCRKAVAILERKP